MSQEASFSWENGKVVPFPAECYVELRDNGYAYVYSNAFTLRVEPTTGKFEHLEKAATVVPQSLIKEIQRRWGRPS